MTTKTPSRPTATLTHLHRADGSATYAHGGYKVIGAVSGPVEVSRREEIPEEASVEVNVRPASGVGSPRERHLELILHAALRNIILVRAFPRSLVQITLQIVSLPEEERARAANSSYIALLPPLLHAAVLALMSASLPLRAVLTSALVAVSRGGEVVATPAQEEMKRARSLHCFAFSLGGEVVLGESEGVFGLAELREAEAAARALCLIGEKREGELDGGGVSLGDAMEVDDGPVNLERWLREVVKAEVEKEERMKA